MLITSIPAPLLLLVTLALGCGSSDDPRDGATDSAGETDSLEPCGGCPDAKTCCPSRFNGDIARCVDGTLNPENCGTCGTFCTGACRDGACIDAPACAVDGACANGLSCSGGDGLARCCPTGTTFIASPADFFGCCPDGDICGCREGECPISVRAAKTDIRYLDAAGLAALGDELLSTRLATYRYNGAASERRQLGFIIDDGAPAHGIAADARHVDLYGYVSLAVATLQTQAHELAELRRELDELRARLDTATLNAAPR